MSQVIRAGVAALTLFAAVQSYSNAAAVGFGPSNPFYAASKLPFRAPPFDRIKDEDYQPAPKLAAHHDAIHLNPKLFARVASRIPTRPN